MNQQAGFTLIELVVVIVISAILMAVGVPSFQTITTNNRIAADTNQLVSSLTLARSEAIKRGAEVSVCMSADGQACTTTGAWDQGWIVRVDSNNEVLRVFDVASGNGTVSSNANIITFTALGGLTPVTPVPFDLNVKAQSRCVTVNAVGRPFVETGACS